MIAEYIKLEWDKKYESSIEIGWLNLQAKATVVPYRATVIVRNMEICQLNGAAQADTYNMAVVFTMARVM